MSRFIQVSVSTAIEPDGTRVREYAAVDDEGTIWRALDVGEPLEWERMPRHPLWKPEH